MLLDKVAYINAVQDTFELTVSSGTVGSDLTDFPLYIDLSHMPSSFWDLADERGGNIRAYESDGTTQIPIDVVFCDPYEQAGAAFVKTDIATGSDTVVVIKNLARGTSMDAFDATYGREAVWVDYEKVLMFGRDGFNRVDSTPCEVNGDPMYFEQVDEKQVLASWCHDGIASDGTHRYVFNGNSIEKYCVNLDSGEWVLIGSNSDPAGDAGISGLNDLGDGCYSDGYLYVISGDNPGGTKEYILKINAGDLTHVDAFDVSATSIGLSGVCVGPNGNLWGIIYGSGTTLYEYDISDGTVLSTVTLSRALLNAQGIEFFDNAFFIAVEEVDTGTVMETYRVETDGTVTSSGLYGDKTGSTAGWPGLAKENDTLLQCDETVNNSDERVRTFRPYAIDLGAGGGVDFWDDARVNSDWASTGDVGTTWTVGITFAHADTTQRTICAMTQTGTGFTNNVHFVVDDGDKVGVWDGSNSWLYTSPTIDPTTDQSYRLHVTYNGTTNRTIMVNGGSKATDTTITARGSGVDTFTIGNAREGAYNDSWRGKIGFAYVRAEALSDDWKIAEYDNLSDTASFYSIAAA